MKMKMRILSATLAAVVTSSALVGCAQQTPPPATNTTPVTETPTTETPTTETPPVASTNSGSQRTGIGVVTGVGSSKSATAEAAGSAQIDSTIAVVTVDADGKITHCIIDATQTKVPVASNGDVTKDGLILKSKSELQDDYGMRARSGIGKEWFEQTEALAEHVIGKTLAEVAAIALDDSGKPTDADLATHVTISSDSYIEAVQKAIQNAVAGTEANGAIKTGAGVTTTAESSSSASRVQVDTYIAAVTLDADGKIVNCSIDVAQTRVPVSATGELTTDVNLKTKHELKDEYNMRGNSGISKEWFEQADTFAQYVIGKTLAEVKAIPMDTIDDGAHWFPDVPELATTVTIGVSDYLEVIEKAINNAK